MANVTKINGCSVADLTARVQISEQEKKITLVRPQNLFQPDKVVKDKFISGYIGNTIKESSKNNFCYCIIDNISVGNTYSASGSSFKCYQLSDDNEIVGYADNAKDSEEVKHITFTVTDERVSKLAVNFRYTSFPLNQYMFVEGSELPDKYTPNFKPYLKLNEEDYAKHYLSASDIEGMSNPAVYNVGTDGDFTSYTECIRALKDDSSEKIIYIHPGEYDIFSEIGGSAYAQTIASGTNWRDVSDIIPPNTKVIGLGRVVFKFMPTSSEIGTVAGNLLSPINVSGTCHLENIEIIARNCRYCIHDETNARSEYYGAKKTYKNLRCKKMVDSVGFGMAYGAGFNAKQLFEFDNCVFISDHTPFSMHDGNISDITAGAKIYMKNCAFISGNDTSVRFGNVCSKQVKIDVLMSNCYLNKCVYIFPESSQGVQNINLTMNGCSDVDVQIVLKEGDENIYPPAKYLI